jgi:type I restriction enzyme S subunit
LTGAELVKYPTPPASWRIVPAWALFRRVKRTGFPDEELLSLYRDHGVVPKASRDDNHNVESEELSGYQLVEPGDLVMNKMKAWQGSVAIAEQRGIVSPAYFVFKVSGSVYPRYIHYLMRSAPLIAAYNRISKGVRVGQWDLEPQEFRKLPILLPPVDEQERIADYLDLALSRMGDLHAGYERFANLVETRSNAEIISWATTGKSENLIAPEKPVPWLESIPKNWAVRPLYWAGRESKRPNPMVEDPTILSLSYGELVEKRATNEGLNPETYDSYQLIRPGDIVFRFTDLQNDQKSLRSAVANDEGLITSAYMAFEPKRMLPRFFGYLMRAYDLLGVFYGMGSGLRQSLRFTEIRTMPVLVPPLDEQEKIAEHLDKHLAASRELKRLAALASRKLAERRASLISSAVGLSGG